MIPCDIGSVIKQWEIKQIRKPDLDQDLFVEHNYWVGYRLLNQAKNYM